MFFLKKNMLKTFKLLWNLNKLLLINSILIRVVLGFIPFLNLIIFKELVNEVTLFIESQNSYLDILQILIIQFIIMIVNSVMINLLDLIDNKLEYKLDYYLQKESAAKAASLPLTYFDDNKFYDHQDRISHGLGNRMLVPIKNLLNIFQRSITLFSYILFLFNVHWLLAILSSLTAIPVLLINKYYGKKNFTLLINQTPKAREASYIRSLLIDRNSSKEIRLFSLKNYLLGKWEKIYISNINETIKLYSKQTYAKIALEIIAGLLYGITAGILIKIIKGGKLSIGEFVAVIQAIQGTQSTINNISYLLANISKENLFINDLFNFLEYEDESTSKNMGFKKFPIIKKGIKFENVSFKYPNSNVEVLKNISFSIIPGEKIAIVGDNGSGKTSLVKCLMGLYPISEGNILFDDISLKDLDEKEIWRNITAIFQDYVKYHFTIKENITIGKIDEIDNINRINEVINFTNLNTVINKYKKGYETTLSKVFTRGEELSEGQWQKVAIARGIFRSGQIFILDEPTASLDPYSELEVYEKFDKLANGQTTIYISHRMSAAKMADRILVLKGGQLIEQGTHNELMKLRGEYADMYNLQAKWYIEKEKGEVI